MASSSKWAPSGKALTDPKDSGKMSFLDMSLDDIIILRKIEYPGFEENTNETQDKGEKNSVSKQQSNAGSSISRENIEGRNNKKPHRGHCRLESRQNPSNRQSLTKKKTCSDNSKAQAEKNRSQSKETQHQLKGSQGQSEENQHSSKRSRGRPEKSCSNLKKPRHQSEGSHIPPKKSDGHSEKSHGYSKRSHGHSERSRGHSERSRGHSERSRGHSERSRGHSERFYGHSERLHGQPRRSPDQSMRSPDQSGRYRRYSPVGRFKTSPKIEYEFERSFLMKNKNGYFQEHLQQRNDLMNMRHRVSLERYHSAYENYRGNESYMHTDVGTSKFYCY